MVDPMRALDSASTCSIFFPLEEGERGAYSDVFTGFLEGVDGP